MSRHLRKVTLALLAIATLGQAGESASLDRLEWMLGSWTRSRGDKTATEEWSRVNPRIFEGRSWFQRGDGERRLGEEILLIEMGGEIFYLPKVAENLYPIPFKLMSLNGLIAVFENPTHDFPRRIVYDASEAGKLLVTISGPGADGADKSIEFPFSRVVAKDPAKTDAVVAE